MIIEGQNVTMGSMRDLDILRHLENVELQLLEEVAECRSCRAGEVILDPDFLGTNIIFIQSGTLQVMPQNVDNPIVIASYTDGNIIGEERLFCPNMPPMASVINKDTDVYTIKARDLKHVFKYNRRMLLKMLWVFASTLSDKIRKVNTTLFELLNDPELNMEELGRSDSKQISCKEYLGHSIPKVEEKIITRLKNIGYIESYIKNHVIFLEGESGDHMYIIEQGTVKIFRSIKSGEEKTLVDLEPGDFFGEMAFVDDLPRSASAMVTSDTAELIAIPQSAMQKILNYGFWLGFNFLGALSNILCLRYRCTLERVLHASSLRTQNQTSRQIFPGITVTDKRAVPLTKISVMANP